MSVPPIRHDGVWLPKSSSTIAQDIDYGFYWAYGVSVVFFVGIVGALVYFMWKYKRRSERDKTATVDHNTTIEILWSGIPFALTIVLFWIGLKPYIKAHVPPQDALEIQVTAQMYGWNFTYPNGLAVGNELVVPKGRAVKLVMSSQDVLHSLYIPEFRVKQDVVPGIYTTMWFEATELGETALLCTEYCGVGHSDMLATVKVLDAAGFSKWYQSGGGVDNLPPAEKGQKIFESRCKACHSVDGTRVQGPSFKGLFGKTEELEGGGTATVDENYLKESILNPGAKIVKGYPASMPTFKGLLKDKDVEALIAYMKTLK
jgi:cytochrome c oxidase subunit 2